MKKYLTQQMNVGGQSIQGPLQGINNIGDIVNKVVTFMIPLAGIILFFVIIWGGYDFLMSQGQPEKMKSAQAKITTGLVGFILLIVSYIVVKLIARIFGVGEGIL